jgi:anti-sigma factor RsiW
MKKNPMTCKEFVESLPAFRDDELTPRDRMRAQGHLAGCERCSAYLLGYEQTIELAKRTASDRDTSTVLPENLVRRMMAARRRS